MLFSKVVYNQRETARYHFLSLSKEARKPLCTAFFQYLSALQAAEAVFYDATEDEREVYETAKAAADAIFASTVKAAEAEHLEVTSSLSDDAELRKNATAVFHKVLGNANNAYERKVHSPSVVLKAVEAQAMVVYERTAGLAYAEFQRAFGIDGTSKNRSPCNAGRNRFVFQRAS